MDDWTGSRYVKNWVSEGSNRMKDKTQEIKLDTIGSKIAAGRLGNDDVMRLKKIFRQSSCCG